MEICARITRSGVLMITSVNIYHSAVSSQRSDQSDHDTRFLYHGLAASKDCPQALVHSFSPQATLGLLCLPIFLHALAREPVRRLWPTDSWTNLQGPQDMKLAQWYHKLFYYFRPYVGFGFERKSNSNLAFKQTSLKLYLLWDWAVFDSCVTCMSVLC